MIARAKKRNRHALGTGRVWRRKQRKGSVWVGDWKDADGTRHRQVLSSDRRVAERKMAEIIRQRDLVAAGLATEDGFDLIVAEVIAEFLAELRARRSPRYADRVERVLDRVVKGMKLRTMRDLQPQPYMLHRRRRLQDGIANRTANMELTVTRTMLNWCVRAGYIAFNPLAAVQGLPAGKGYEKHPRRALSEDEIERFLAASIETDQHSLDYALAAKTVAAGTKPEEFNRRERTPTVPQTPLWLALLETGARYGETVQARWGDFSEARATLTLRAATTKSRKERTIPLRRALAETIAGLRLVHHQIRGRIPTGGDYIFLTPKGAPWVENRRNALYRFEAVLLRAGIAKVDERGQKLDIHSLRHSAASRWARCGVPLQKAQALLGHSDPKLTAAIYTHLETEDLRAAVEAAGAPRRRREVAQ